jgi:hypothetical protein
MTVEELIFRNGRIHTWSKILGKTNASRKVQSSIKSYLHGNKQGSLQDALKNLEDNLTSISKQNKWKDQDTFFTKNNNDNN